MNRLIDTIARRAVRRMATRPLPTHTRMPLSGWMGIALLALYIACAAFTVIALAMELLQ